MRGKDLLDKMELLDDRYVAEADEKMNCGKSRRIGIAALIAAALIIVGGVGAGIAMHQRSGSDQYQTAGCYVSIDRHVPEETESSEELLRIYHWDELNDCQRYKELEYDGRIYTSRMSEDGVGEDYIGEYLGRYNAVGFDYFAESEEDALHTLEAEVYAIRGIDTRAAVCAVLGEEDKTAYVYTNGFYIPATLGEFIDALDLDETMTTGLVYDHNSDSIVFEDVETSFIRERLFADRTLENRTEPVRDDRTVFGITVSVELLGYRDVSLWLTDGGWMVTNILDTGKYFYIGREAVYDFIEEVRRSYQAYHYIYDVVQSDDIIEE